MVETSFLDRMRGEPFGTFASNRACQTCLFARGEQSWDGLPEGWTLAPDHCYCLIYEPPRDKPNDVAFDGADCIYYEDENSDEQ